MLITKMKEDISVSYISALCAYAGIVYDIIRHDEDGADGMLQKRILLEGNRKREAVLRIQLKCTSSSSQYTDQGDIITYKLKTKSYNDLCLPSTTPIILGLLILPEEEELWINWKSTNDGTVTVKIPKENIINVESLQEILTLVAKEEWP